MSHSPGTYVPSTLICSLLCMSLSTQRETVYCLGDKCALSLFYT